MPELSITTSAGESFSISMPEPSEYRSFFVFAMPKSGSTLLNKLLRSVCKEVAMPVVAPTEEAFLSGVQPTQIDASVEQCFKPRGYAYLGFRGFFGFEPSFDLSSVNKIVLVRDPRDMLVSLYFSIRYSHPMPKAEGSVNRKFVQVRQNAAETDIEDFVLDRAKMYQRTFRQFRTSIPTQRRKLYRYEDVVFDKENWLKDMLEFLELPALDDQTIQAIVAPHDIMPGQENPSKHIRQVTPGNYKKHLSAKAIKMLNQQLGPVLDDYGYDR